MKIKAIARELAVRPGPEPDYGVSPPAMRSVVALTAEVDLGEGVQTTSSVVACGDRLYLVAQVVELSPAERAELMARSMRGHG